LVDPRPIKQRQKLWRSTMLAFELVGMALFALFFGALITNKESVSR
jgi:hypothetical protein